MTATQVYQWGIIYDPSTRKRVKCHLPVEIPTSQRTNSTFEQVACGNNFTLVLDSNHRVSIVGDEPKHGRLGQGDETSVVTRLTPFTEPLPPMGFISCGPATSILLSIDGRELWGFGKGLGLSPRQIFNTAERITHCACGENSIVIVIDACRIEERRFNRTGFITDWTPVYRMMQNNDRIHQLDMGSSVNGFVTEHGHVYLWGTNVPACETSLEEQSVDVSIKQPVQRDLIDGNSTDSDRPRSISCSRGQFHTHVLLLTEQGHIYAMGSNYKSKLGIDRNQLFAGQWTLIESTRTCPFQMIAAGGIHSSALSVDGRVFTWGCGSDGRLGHAESAGHRYLYREDRPRPVDALGERRISSIASSYYHMAAIVS